MAIKICACTSPLCEVFPLTPTRLPLREHPLAHTSVHAGRCAVCRGLVAFPPCNLALALEEGTDETWAILQEILT